VTWTFTVDRQAGEVTLVDPAGGTVGTFTGSDPPRVEARYGVPVDPDIRAEAAQHTATQYQNGNVELGEGVKWAMARFKEV